MTNNIFFDFDNCADVYDPFALDYDELYGAEEGEEQ